MVLEDLWQTGPVAAVQGNGPTATRQREPFVSASLTGESPASPRAPLQITEKSTVLFTGGL